MPRRPRIDFAGFHHIINRGVDRGDVFREKKDKEQFLKIVCKACKIYKINVHDYCLMDNHYHMLIELTSENLSLFMRQVNSNYAIYFNKKYNRSGHLWQGRFKSYYILDEQYLFTLYRYIEQNPIKAKIVQTVGKYEFTLIATLLNPKLSVIACAEHSQLKTLLKEEGILGHLALDLTTDETEYLKKEQTRKIEIKEHELKLQKSKTLQEHFEVEAGKDERNIAIINAIDDGYTQASIAKHLDVSTSAISKIVKKFNV